MAIGRKSLVRKFQIANKALPKSPYVVIVQANKNHGICDIVVGSIVTQKIVNEYTDHRGKKFTKTRTRETFVESDRLSDVLSTFQGRQYDDEEVMAHLYEVIEERMNFRS